ncbi:protein of unknown function [Chryseobacterium taichungense]|uniref:DUF4469 domain-containing protein n=1 Tax=Chryseobacterium taichungense TaxID=295069 RepID=A0A1H7Z8T1_9FLAO|nr:DUF4469 domain-containing protein [Chryseobacterium taichungense]SEM53899.1 protein of unknown function [Chryseobacterium taichungense]
MILQVTDVKSDFVNDLLTSGRNLEIAGSTMKVTGEDPSVGVFFVNAAMQARIKLEASDIVTNNPSEVMVVIPELAAGTYEIKVVTQYAGIIILKEPRVATLTENWP